MAPLGARQCQGRDWIFIANQRLVAIDFGFACVIWASIGKRLRFRVCAEWYFSAASLEDVRLIVLNESLVVAILQLEAILQDFAQFLGCLLFFARSSISLFIGSFALVWNFPLQLISALSGSCCLMSWVVLNLLEGGESHQAG